MVALRLRHHVWPDWTGFMCSKILEKVTKTKNKFREDKHKTNFKIFLPLIKQCPRRQLIFSLFPHLIVTKLIQAKSQNVNNIANRYDVYF